MLEVEVVEGKKELFEELKYVGGRGGEERSRSIHRLTPPSSIGTRNSNGLFCVEISRPARRFKL